MATIDLIWDDFLDTKYGDEYLVLYSERQKDWRKYFKLATLAISAGGVISAFIDAKVPTVILCIIVCLIQLISLLENTFIPTEKDIEEFCKLRLLYCEHWGNLEKLFNRFYNNRISDEEAQNEYFNLKNHKNTVIEPLDTKLNIKKWERLMKKAEEITLIYIKRYNHE